MSNTALGLEFMSKNFSKFYDNFSSRNNVKGAIVARCLNVHDLRNLLNIKHNNLEGSKHPEAIVCTGKFLMQAHFRETGHGKTSQSKNYNSWDDRILKVTG